MRLKIRKINKNTHINELPNIGFDKWTIRLYWKSMVGDIHYKEPEATISYKTQPYKPILPIFSCLFGAKLRTGIEVYNYAKWGSARMYSTIQNGAQIIISWGDR